MGGAFQTSRQGSGGRFGLPEERSDGVDMDRGGSGVFSGSSIGLIGPYRDPRMGDFSVFCLPDAHGGFFVAHKGVFGPGADSQTPSGVTRPILAGLAVVIKMTPIHRTMGMVSRPKMGLK